MRIAIASVVLFCPMLLAQSWSVTASAPTVGTASAGGWPGGSSTTHSLPIGPVAPGTFLSVINSSGSAYASWAPSVTGQTAPLAFTASVTAVATNHYSNTFDSAYLSAQLDLSLHAPQPTGGRLLVSWTATSNQGGSSRIDLDVGADGTVDLQGATYSGSGVVDLPLQIAATDSVVRLALTGSGMATQGSYASGAYRVDVQFFPDQPAIRVFDTTGSLGAIAISHPVGDAVTLSLDPFPQVNVLVFGFQPMVNPITPTLTQLISVDTYFVINSITLTLPPLPTGTTLYCQGLYLDWQGNLHGTSSVRALWP